MPYSDQVLSTGYPINVATYFLPQYIIQLYLQHFLLLCDPMIFIFIKCQRMFRGNIITLFTNVKIPFKFYPKVLTKYY